VWETGNEMAKWEIEIGGGGRRRADGGWGEGGCGTRLPVTVAGKKQRD
jgi:hypothetical protein